MHVRSAGSDPAEQINPAVVEAMADLGIDLGEEFPKPLTDEVVRAADAVITMGCGDACPSTRASATSTGGSRIQPARISTQSGQSATRSTGACRRCSRRSFPTRADGARPSACRRGARHVRARLLRRGRDHGRSEVWVVQPARDRTRLRARDRRDGVLARAHLRGPSQPGRLARLRAQPPLPVAASRQLLGRPVRRCDRRRLPLRASLGDIADVGATQPSGSDGQSFSGRSSPSCSCS